VAAADEHFGTLHILVNVAGVSNRGTIWDTTPDLWDWIMAVNVCAPYLLIQESVKIMRCDGVAGAIVNVGSLAAYGNVPILMPYAVSKGALVIASPDPFHAGAVMAKPFSEFTKRSWNYVTVGYGHSEEWWVKFVVGLRMIGYDDVLSIEHEDFMVDALEGVTKAATLLQKVALRLPPSYTDDRS